MHQKIWKFPYILLRMVKKLKRSFGEEGTFEDFRVWPITRTAQGYKILVHQLQSIAGTAMAKKSV